METTLTAIKTNLYVNEDIFSLRKTNFVLWRPAKTDPKPKVYIAHVEFNYSESKILFEKTGEHELLQSKNFSDLWLLNVQDCNLTENTIYYYWFKVKNSNPYEKNEDILYVTDPYATVVDERMQANNIPVPELHQHQYSPAGVFIYLNGQMMPADPDKEMPDWGNLSTGQAISQLQPNNKLVIYELPPRWSYFVNYNTEILSGNFRQVQKMVGWYDNSTHLDKLLGGIVLPEGGKKYIEYMGINALQLTPPANSKQQFDWGYGTAEYFAPDFNLSDRDKEGVKSPKPATDIVNLVKTCHSKGIRFFYDAAMAFSSDNPYRHINYLDFFVQWDSGDPEQDSRDSFGGDLVKYRYMVTGYNPNLSTDQPTEFSPSREYMIAHLKEWIRNKGASALRIDSVVNIDCYDFLSEISWDTRSFFIDDVRGTDDKYLVVGEELAVPKALLDQQRLDGMWNELFKAIVRHVILGRNYGNDNFEWSVRKLIDCRLLDHGFTKGTQAVNYITCHNVDGYFNERIYNYLKNNGLDDASIEKRIKLAFSCLLTAVGLPMILAGDEFGDQQDLLTTDTKQYDPVNYERLAEDTWRQYIFHQVVRLIRFRTSSNALTNDDTNFIHCDFNDGKRVMVWKRGTGEDIVITVANFSDWGSDSNHMEYYINNWPLFNGSKAPAGKKWVDITQARYINYEWIGREAIYPWEAKVYALVDQNFSFEKSYS